VYLVGRPGSTVQLIWVRTGNCRTKTLLAAFDRSWLAIESCFAAGDPACRNSLEGNVASVPDI